ncbi:MAG: DUF3881 family protein [Lachnospiraceae bacterium]|nr:DUF3881 family protein [Lachnospiraceae bacterium]
MHRLLRSIGYSEIEYQEQVEELLRLIVRDTKDRQFIRKKAGPIITEYRGKVSDSTGICVCGEEDANGKFHVTHYFPYCINEVQAREEDYVAFDKKVAGDGYTGMCDDYAIGATMIFYVQNVVDYMFKHEGENGVDEMTVSFSALSDKANIILPTVVREETPKTIIKNNRKEKLIEQAKNGDEKAIVSLSMEDIDKYAIVNERAKKEDILSIVETSLVPLGSESDLYILVGNIRDVRIEINSYTGEEVYILLIDMNTILVNVSINKKDLFGEPEIGRRFRGNVWLQGKVTDTKEYVK